MIVEDLARQRMRILHDLKEPAAMWPASNVTICG
jgi:hypothetical protein